MCHQPGPYQLCLIEKQGLLGKEVNQCGVEVLHQIGGHVPQDVELWVKGSHIGGKASLDHRSTHIVAQGWDHLLTLGAGELEQAFDALVCWRNLGNQGPCYVLDQSIDGE